jgi:hypothetical protein
MEQVLPQLIYWEVKGEGVWMNVMCDKKMDKSINYSTVLSKIVASFGNHDQSRWLQQRINDEGIPEGMIIRHHLRNVECQHYYLYFLLQTVTVK